LNLRPLLPALVAGAFAAVLPVHAQSGPFGQSGPISFNAFNDWLGSDSQGIRIGADGRLRLASALRRVAQIPEGVIWSVVPDGQGGAFISAGTEGKIFRYSNGQVRPLAQVKGGILFAMARLGQDLIVAPSGEGKLLRISPQGEAKTFAEIEAKVVWALSADNGEVHVAGAGERGAVLLLAREGSSRRLVDLPEESAFTCMISDAEGGWYLGTHGRGLVVRYRGGDRIETLFDAPFEEVRALALVDGQLFVGADNGLGRQMLSGQLEKREGFLQTDTQAGAKSAVFRLDKARVPELLWQSATSQVFSLQPWKGQLLVGTGNRSRLFALPLASSSRDQEPFAALQELGTAQASSFLPMGSELMVVGSNPGELFMLSEAQATEGTLESRVLRGAPLADWGRTYVETDTPQGTSVELQFRTGSTETPDATWTPWTPPLRSGERTNLPSSRFAQFRLRLSSTKGGTSPVVESVTVYSATRNLAPVWEGVELMPAGLVITRNAPPEDIGIERVPFETQKLIPALSYAGGEKRSFRRGAQSFVFKVADPNNDQLQFSIRLLPEKGSPILLEKAWKERFFSIDTLPVPDGRYRLEVTATDSPSQPFNQALSSTWRTPIFVIDHTPPTISELTALPEGDNLRVRFSARDEQSVLKDAALSVDGEHWLQVSPEDRVFDQKEERFDIVVPKEMLRGDRVLVRVSDHMLNEQSASVQVGPQPKR
jgi:hypothetical protein